MYNRREKNIQIYTDTMDWIKENEKLLTAVRNSVENQRLYLENENIEVSLEGNQSCETVVSKKRSFEAASPYARDGKKVCVLNFASATNPGGGVTNGSSAQEEALCRCSTLHPCLNEKSLWEKFYIPHREMNDPLYNADCIYTPGVIVCKSDTSEPKRMEEKDWYKVDILTCAAPNLRRIPSNRMNPFAGDTAAEIDSDVLYQLHLKRMERIFQIAVQNGTEVLILGAFGCGAFMNPPEVVAKAFKTVQKKYETCFDAIEYAIYCRDYEAENLRAFQEAFSAR